MTLFYIVMPLAVLIALIALPLALRGMIRNIRDVRTGRKTHTQILKPVLLRMAVIFAVLLCLFGVIFFIVESKSGGPGMLKAIGASKEYLLEQHGKSDQWNISIGKHIVTSTNPPSGYYIVNYRYSGHTGELKATYMNYPIQKTFEIEESPQK